MKNKKVEKAGFKEKVKQEPVVFLFKKMWKYAERKNRKFIFLFVSFSIIANFILLSVPYVFGRFLNEIQDNGISSENITLIFLFLGSFLLIDLLFWVFHGTSRIIEKITAFKIQNTFKESLVKKTLSLDLNWHAEKDSGDVIDKVNNSSNALWHFSRNFYDIISIIIKGLGTTAILMFFNFYIGLLALIILILTFYVILKFDKKLVPQYQKINIYGNKILAKTFDILSNIVSVKILRIEKEGLESIKKSLWKPFKLYKENTFLLELKWFTGSLFFKLIIVIPLGFYIFYLYKNNLKVEIGVISMMYMYLSDLINVYYTFSSKYEELMYNKAKVENAEEIEKSFTQNKNIERKSVGDWKKLKIKNFDFRWANFGPGY